MSQPHHVERETVTRLHQNTHIMMDISFVFLFVLCNFFTVNEMSNVIYQ